MQQLDSAPSAIILYQTADGQTSLDVRLQEETVWLSLTQIAELFDRDKSVISRHLRNIFREGELVRAAVVAKNATTAADGKTYQVEFFNLDAIISVGYRVNSKRGTQFRIWASSVLKEYLVKGYALNRRRLAEQGVAELRGVLDLLAAALERNQLTDETGLAVVELVRRYGMSWQLLLQYDEDRLALPAGLNRRESVGFDLAMVRRGIACLREELAIRGEATDLFGRERGESLAGILGAIHQTFGGQDLYPSIEEKAAHLLYFVIKDHPFSDGNKRIGSFLFLLYLQESGLIETVRFDNKAVVALALLVAASDPVQKEVLIRLIVNLLGESIPSDGGGQHG
ncbi:filamentation induced by cAMP protein Fic [Desulfobulbus propionicus DSM 2032]|uniref:Filamentation induced by cAMP protein Fic n=1 Tax=Desulfobulbus propionicus (strain ATCC 33891 / DSM 2032 / VKM B-1956 / 1pr3) TaxID=577650 RepID=A0A7U3YLM3_DESPD|nr:virulence protein RhuM/Fic/DOC family protein [Desulfobulbus propionicus]ADW17645.1 filamentation induced by cAMP protein Fic [Desulfobulbus propionicus DSM 2032]